MKATSIIKFISLLYVIQGSFGAVSFGWSWPIQEVSHPACKSLHRDELPDFCKLDLPSISQEDFQASYGNQTLLQLIFSLPREAPYKDPTAIGKGSHPSLDIATAKGTPVYAMGKGKVVSAGKISGYGNSVTIKHQFAGGVLYSSYNHLDKIFVSQGDTVKEGQHIGKVGNSGFYIGKYGNHLDFQITTEASPLHPYGFGEFTGERYIDIVNQGLHQDKLSLYTIDPIAFLTETQEQETEYMRKTVNVQWTKAYAKINSFFMQLANTLSKNQKS